MACDDVVVAETDNPMGYANCLVETSWKELQNPKTPKPQNPMNWIISNV